MTQVIRIIGLVVAVFGINVASFAGNGITSLVHRYSGNDAQSYKYGGKELYRMEGMNLYDFHARNQSATTQTFTTPDPKLEDYPGISPYAYCAGNPIMLIDPTGERTLHIDSNGYIINDIEDDPNNDKIIVIDNSQQNNIENEKKEGEKDGNEIILGKGAIIDVKKDITVKSKDSDIHLTTIKLKDSDSGNKLFKFLTKNETTGKIEWSMNTVGTSDKGTTFVGNMHHKSKTAQGHFLLKKGFSIVKDVHSHPGGSGPSSSDIEIGKEIISKFPNAQIEIYIPKQNKFIPIKP